MAVRAALAAKAGFSVMAGSCAVDAWDCARVSGAAASAPSDAAKDATARRRVCVDADRKQFTETSKVPSTQLKTIGTRR